MCVVEEEEMFTVATIHNKRVLYKSDLLFFIESVASLHFSTLLVTLADAFIALLTKNIFQNFADEKCVNIF